MCIGAYFYRCVPNTPDKPVNYNTYGVTVTEVELDVLTGEHQVCRMDVLYDCGESMSPLVGMFILKS